MNVRLSAVAFCGGVCFAVPVVANADTPFDHNAVSLDPVVVTPTRSVQTIADSLSSVTVIDREEIERLDPRDFIDLLQARAGVDVYSTGGFGQQSGVFLRGAASDQTVLLVDGVRMGSATAGGAAWQFIPPEQIERVEIVRGPRSSVYGADAIGGVVQVFTKQGQKGPPAFNAHVGGGSFGSHEYGAGVSGGTAQTSYQFSAAHRHTDGINVLDSVGDDQRDGYHNTSASLGLDHRFNDRLAVFARSMYARGRSAFNHEDFMQVPSESAHIDFEQWVASVGLRAKPIDGWQTELSVAQSRDEQDTYIAYQFSDRFDTQMTRVDWRNEFELAENWLWTAGIDWREDKVDSTTDYEEEKRGNLGVYQVLQGTVAAHLLQASLRYDDNQAYGSETTGGLAWGYQFSDHLTSRASFETGFNAPNFNQLYWPGFGNPDLKPETAETVEVGLRYAKRNWYVDGALFHTRVDNLINQQPENVDARMQGAELETGWQHDGWNLRAAISLLDTENRDTGEQLARRPDQTARIDIDRDLNAFFVGTSVVARSHAVDYVFNPETFATQPERLSGYALVNLRAGYQFARHWQISGRIDNLFDREYSTAAYGPNAQYNNPGRAFYLTLRYQQ